jgi:arsenate reductase (thioredoxin)
MPELLKMKVLFVCIGNCVRSQMAEAIARHAAADIIEAESAGVRPLGFIDPTAKAVLASRGISVDGQWSKGLHSHKLEKPDLIVNMSGLPGDSLFHGRVFEDWRVSDPFGDDVETHLRVCDDIETRIMDLAQRLRSAREGDSPQEDSREEDGIERV